MQGMEKQKVDYYILFDSLRKNTPHNVSYVKEGKVVNIMVCGSHQQHLGLIMKCSEIRHYAYTYRL